MLCVSPESINFISVHLKKRDIKAGRVQNSPGLLFSEMTKIQNIQSTRY